MKLLQRGVALALLTTFTLASETALAYEQDKTYKITNFGCVIRRQANNGNFQILTLKQRPWFKQALASTFLVDIGGKQRELSPLFLLA